jgi:hypothetical protein
MKIKENIFILLLKRNYRKLNKKYNDVYFHIQRKKNKMIFKKNIKKNVFAVEIYSHMGIGANLVWALEIMAFCNEKNLIPKIKFIHPNDKQKNDNFGNYFETPNTSLFAEKFNYMKMRSFNDLNLDLKWNYNEKLNLTLANLLIEKFLIIKKEILHEINIFQSIHFQNKKVLGVHYRGTDKKSEAELISYETVLKNINFYLKKFPETSSIFLSSDDLNFINYIKKNILIYPVIFNNDSFRSSNDLPIHTTKNNLYEINKDAVINCLLLSKCNTLMKTASILSDWSKLFNPNISLILLSKPFENYRFFPGKEFYDHVLYSTDSK